MSKEKRIKTCPFCGSICEGSMYINLICGCGAKYYCQSDIWLDRKTGKEVKGDVWKNHSMSKEKQIDAVYELISKYHEAWKHGEGDWKRGLAERIVDEEYQKQSEGEWITKDLGFTDIYVCSSCNKSVDFKFQRTLYCPNCGAKMKGGEGDGKN